MATQNFYEILYCKGKWYVDNGLCVTYGRFVKTWKEDLLSRPKEIQVGFFVSAEKFGEAIEKAKRLEKIVTFKKARGLR